METTEGLRMYEETLKNNNFPFESVENTDHKDFFLAVKDNLSRVHTEKNISDEHTIERLKSDLGIEELQKIKLIESQNFEKNEIKVNEDKFSYYVDESKLEQIQEIIKLAKENNHWWDDNFDELFKNSILKDKKKIVQLLLDEGFPANKKIYVKDISQRIPVIYFAANEGNFEIVKILVSKGAIHSLGSPGDKEACRSTMCAVIDKGYIDIVQFLLENGYDPNGYYTCDNPNPYESKRVSYFEKALLLSQKKIADLLVFYGANIELALENKYEEFKKVFKGNETNKNFNQASKLNIFKKLLPNKNREEFYLVEDPLQKEYASFVQRVLDHAIGFDFDIRDGRLYFLENLNISNFNFIGLSINGEPITKKMLKKMGLKGYKNAIINYNDLNKIEDKNRQNDLTERLEKMFHARGKLISKKGIVNLVALEIAVGKGLLEVVNGRLSGKKQTANEFNRALDIAVRKGFYEIVKLLIEQYSYDQKFLLDLKKNTKHEKISAYLIACRGVNELDEYGEALIHRAVIRKDIKEIQQLFNRGADINLKNSEGNTPLILAAINAGQKENGHLATDDDIKLLETLLSMGADPNLFTGYCDNFSPLTAAAVAGSLRAMQLLLPLTQKREFKEEGKWYVQLMFESFGSKEWLSILSLLIKNGADLNETCESYIVTLLHKTILRLASVWERGQLDEIFAHINFLLENGARPAVMYEPNERTCLHFFVREINIEVFPGATEKVIGLLLKYGININVTDGIGMTPLHYAVGTNNLSATIFLIDNGADIHALTKEGNTPLHIAAAGNPKTTRFLIQAGADTNAKNVEELSPLAYSKQVCNKKYVFPSRQESYLEAQKLLEDYQ